MDFVAELLNVLQEEGVVGEPGAVQTGEWICIGSSRFCLGMLIVLRSR